MRYVEIDYSGIVHATDLAVCVDVGFDVWLPFSAIRDVDNRDDMDESGGTLEVAEWIAIDKGLV